MTEVALTDARQVYGGAVLRADHDRYVPGMSRLADMLHTHGTKIFGQLYHPGGNMSGSPDGRRRVLYGPSENLSGRYHATSRAMTRADIVEAIELFAQAAGRMAAAAMTASSFTPGMGACRTVPGPGAESPRRRLRWPRRNANAASSWNVCPPSEAQHPALAVGLRLSPPDPDPLSEETRTLPDICAAIEAEADPDYFSITAGSMRDIGGSVHVVPPMGIPAEDGLAHAADVRARVSKPVLAAGRIHTPAEAEALLDRNACDLIGLARPMICDPLWSQKALGNEPDRIRGCISCNQACIGHLHLGVAVSCIQHPESGREHARRHQGQSTASQSVLVIGGGPAGMKAAAIAAARGHAVTLCEATARLGGQVLLAQTLPGRAEFGGVTENLTREMAEAGVTVRLNTPLSVSDVTQFGADVVILATGARQRAAPAAPEIVSPDDILTQSATCGSGFSSRMRRATGRVWGWPSTSPCPGMRSRLPSRATWPVRRCRNMCGTTGWAGFAASVWISARTSRLSRRMTAPPTCAIWPAARLSN